MEMKLVTCFLLHVFLLLYKEHFVQSLNYTLKWNNECINSWKTQKKASTQIIEIIFSRSFVCIDKMDLGYWHHLVLQVYMDWFLAYFEDTMWNLHITISSWKRNFQSLKCEHNMNICSCLISFLKFRAHFVKDCNELS